MLRFLLAVLTLAALGNCTVLPHKASRLPQGITRTITVDANRPGKPLYAFWTVANYNHPHSLVEPTAIPELLLNAPYVTEVNCVYLLGGRWPGQNQWLLAINEDGSLKTDFTGLIAQIRGVTNAGFTPWIVLDNVPDLLRSGKATCVWQHRAAAR